MKRLLLLLFVIFLTAAPAYAQKSFDMRYNEAVEYYTKKDYDKAIKVLDAAKKSPGVTKDQIAKANRLKNQCTAAKQKMSDLNLSKELIMASGSGQLDSIYVTAGKAWSVTSCPTWIKTRQEADVLFIEVLPNKEKASKKGIIEVSMGKERTAYVVVNQEQRLDINCPIRVITRPERAMVIIDNNQGMLSEDFVLSEGKHRIRIEKSGYERKDTTVVIGLNSDGSVYEFALKPLFATISVEIRPADGYSFDGNPTLDISGNEVNLYPSIIKRFNVDQDISYYSLYDGNVIPLHPGQYVLKASADGFVSERMMIEAVRAEKRQYEFVLSPICGTVSVSDEENAAGAVVFVDDKEIGTVPVVAYTVKKGVHKIRIEKPGFKTDAAEFEVEVFENKDTEFKAIMQRFAEYSITSEPSYCKIYLDGEYAGTTPLNVNLLEGDHSIRVEKNGFYPISRNITPTLDGELHEVFYSLENAYPLTITADRDSLDVIVSKGSGKGKTIMAESVRTPATVQLPLSKTPYHIELLRSDRKPVYKGNFNFSKKSSDRLNILTWSEGSPFVGGNFYLLGPVPYLSKSLLNKDYSRLADVSLSTFRLLPGLSTSLAKATLFVGESDKQITYPANEKGKYEVKPGDDGYKDITVIPALSVLLINEEFRVGGALLPFLDADILATYTWYPNLSSFLNFTHMSGHDVFLGAEFSSRIKVFNVNVKAGYQRLFNGKAHICRPIDVANGDSKMYTANYRPDDNMFVVTIGFTLGAGNCRGQNILRVF